MRALGVGSVGSVGGVGSVGISLGGVRDVEASLNYSTTIMEIKSDVI